MKKILVIQTAFIGDVVLATGIIEKLHSFYPDAQIDFLVRKGNEGLLKDHPFVHVFTWNKKQHKFRNLLNTWWKVVRSRYDLVVNVQRYAATGFLAGCSGAGRRIGFDKNPLNFLFTDRIAHSFEEGVHEISRNHKLIEAFTDARPGRPRLYPGNYAQKLQAYKHAPYICIAPASVWFTKQFPIDKWLEFLNRLPYDFAVYLLGGPEDANLCNTLKVKTNNPFVIDLSGQLSLLESISMIRDAAMNYVNDSAPMHFASSVNAPVTVVYCSTVPAFGYGPLSDKRHVVQLFDPLYCRPCGLHGHSACPEDHFRCARDIRIDQLLATLPAPQLPVYLPS